MAAVQVYFADGGQRDYFIVYCPPHHGFGGRKDGRWWARSLATLDVPNGLDLRKPEHARRLEVALADFDPAVIDDE
jgi:hypothetical protein